MEHHANLLWIPLASPYNTNQAWLDTHFKNGDRAEIVIFQSENVLTPKALKEVLTFLHKKGPNAYTVFCLLQMLALHRDIQEITVDGQRFSDICTRLVSFVCPATSL